MIPVKTPKRLLTCTLNAFSILRHFPSHLPLLNINRLSRLGLLLIQLGLALRGNLFVKLAIVTLGLLLLDLLGLLGSRRPGLLGTVSDLALLANVGLGGLVVSHDIALLNPELISQPDGQGSGLRALDVDTLDVAPLGRNPLLDETRSDSIDVVGNLLGGPVGVTNANGGVGRRRQANEGGTNGLLNLLGNLGSTAGIDIAVRLLLVLGRSLLGTTRDDNGDGSLRGRLVESLAKDLGQTVDDSVVAEEHVMLGEELALRLILGELCLELGDINDSANLLAQLSGELLRGYNVLVGALGVGGDQTDGEGLVFVVESVRKLNLTGLQTSLVDNVALGGQSQPHGGIGGEFVVVIVGEEVLLGRLGFSLGGGLLDGAEESFGGFEGLPTG